MARNLYTVKTHRPNGDNGCRFVELKTTSGISVTVCLDCATVHVEGTSEVFYRQSCGHTPTPSDCALCALETADLEIEAAGADEVVLSATLPEAVYSAEVEAAAESVVAYMFATAPDEEAAPEIDDLQLDLFGEVVMPEVEPTPEPKRRAGWFSRAMKLQAGLPGLAA
jgi:hypothetical protein